MKLMTYLPLFMQNMLISSRRSAPFGNANIFLKFAPASSIMYEGNPSSLLFTLLGPRNQPARCRCTAVSWEHCTWPDNVRMLQSFIYDLRIPTCLLFM